jgi:hypothetical protein
MMTGTAQFRDEDFGGGGAIVLAGPAPIAGIEIV